MPKEDHEFLPASQLMQAGEIVALAKHFVSLGVNKIRLTGGEPLVRKDAGEIMEQLSRLPVALTLTTNAIRVHAFIQQIKSAGIRSINVSLDTLHEDKFQLMTRRDHFKTVWQNIQLLLDAGLHVKVNVVVMKGLNDNEIKEFIAWTRNTPVHVRFIEFMPFSGNSWTSNKVFTWQEILQEAAQHYDFLPLKGEANDTARKYIVPSHAGTFAVISTMSAPFCSTCNRLRLTADGKLKNCLFSQEETDLLSALRQGQDIEPLIRESLLRKFKERGGQFVDNMEQLQADTIQNRSMIAIGG
jgi:cyclic pyranopterin phosphate synthase